MDAEATAAAPLVYAITLNWNRCQDTLECLESLARQTYPNLRLMVVDNASTDGSREAIAARYPHVEQVHNARNLGFAGGFNAGLRRALAQGADYAFVVNNDTTMAPDVVGRLVAAAGPGVGGVAPLIFDAAQPEAVWSSGGGRNRLTLELTGNHGRGESLRGMTEREFLSGCAVLLSREALERVGVFDERFFMYYEDSDYCLRVRQAGLKLVVEPEAHLWHKVSVSSEGSNSPAERYWMARSSVLFFRKHVRGARWAVVGPYRAASALRTTLRLLRAGRGAAMRAYWRGLWDGLKE